MGALHAGHLSLADLARAQTDKVVVSIFVNPTQFAPHEDFDRYPRVLERDTEMLAGRADLIFAPSATDMYPEGAVTSVQVAGPALGLESDFRPHFFAGVATVVAKLLIAATPDIAVFGEKDYQQLLVVRQLTRDLLLPTEIVGAPILRETDGLAMSSRNGYLSAGERAIAPNLNRNLKDAIEKLRTGSTITTVERTATERLLAAGFQSVDYVAVRDAATLQKLTNLERPARILAAAKIGTTRLIDNMAV
jgi:pantoate--beta-alanine ligase